MHARHTHTHTHTQINKQTTSDTFILTKCTLSNTVIQIHSQSRNLTQTCHVDLGTGDPSISLDNVVPPTRNHPHRPDIC